MPPGGGSSASHSNDLDTPHLTCRAHKQLHTSYNFVWTDWGRIALAEIQKARWSAQPRHGLTPGAVNPPVETAPEFQNPKPVSLLMEVMLLHPVPYLSRHSALSTVSSSGRTISSASTR
jgi:hypothetical protein